LADYQRLWTKIESAGIGLVAASVDPFETARDYASDLGLEFPVGWGLQAEEVSKATGAFFEPDRKFLQAAGFLLRPGGQIEVACYSTGMLGRLVGGDVLRLVEYHKSMR
jgi:peroxiredoxin